MTPWRVTGPIVCTCFGVGLIAIREALDSRAATSVEEIGEVLRAGTNCGSCLPELKKVVAAGHAGAATAEAPTARDPARPANRSARAASIP